MQTMKTADLTSVEDMLVHVAGTQVSPTMEECAREAGVASGGGGGGSGGGAECGRRLLAAARGGDVSAVRALMAAGAPFANDWLGTSPLHVAAAGDHVDCLRVLLRAGVSRDARTKVERTPLHEAAGAGHVRAAAALLQGGADVTARDMLRMTALHWAAQRGHEETVRLLLAAGAPADARNKFGLTARQLAARAGHRAVLHVLDGAARIAREDDASEPTGEESSEPAPPPPPPAPATSAGPGPETASSASPVSGAALLRRHGITLLPRDDTPTVLRALRDGRTLVLSDAGKLMLKESSSSTGGVVVKATRARSPPRPGVKVFTLSARPAAGGSGRPLRKVIHPKDVQLDGSRGVKLVMNRANFRRLVAEAGAGQTVAVTGTAALGTAATATATATTTTAAAAATPAPAFDYTVPAMSEPEPELSPQWLVSELVEARAAERLARARLVSATRRVQLAEAALAANGLSLPQ